MELEQLKREYSLYEKKHKLPSFKELNENFEIEKIERQSELLLRIIRVIMMEKVIATQRFIESLMNPANAPRILYKYLKSMSQEDTKNLEAVHDKFAFLTLKVLSLDVEYKEDKEAEMIKEIQTTWEGTKKSLHEIIKSVQNPKEQQARKEKSYFG
jgi:hypothetical protein